MTRLLAVLISCLSLSFAACGEDSKDWSGDYKKIVDEACACQDAACYDSVKAKRNAMRKQFKEEYRDKKAEGKAIRDKLGAHDDAWRKCFSEGKTTLGKQAGDKVRSMEAEMAEEMAALEAAQAEVAKSQTDLAAAKTEAERANAMKVVEEARAKLDALRKPRRGKRTRKPKK